MKLEPIRLRLVPRQPLPAESNPREAFWRAARREGDRDDIAWSEGRLSREFGPTLRRLLIEEFSAQARDVERILYRDEFEELEGLLSRFSGGPSSENASNQGSVLALARLIEQRRQVLRENAPPHRLQERIAAARAVTFSVRIADYSSLNLDLSLAPLTQVAAAFENDFDSFRVFLEAFVPQAFGSVFWDADADRIEFSVEIPPTYEKEFSRAGPPEKPATQSAPSSPALSDSTQAPSARTRAEWLWRLANGSLLVPLLLALFVMYQGMGMLKDIATSQNQALKPILEHQLKLLEEDRNRLFKEPQPPVVPIPSAAGPSANP